MRFLWDTSAAINALVSKPVLDRLQTGEHFYRTHLLSEFFSIVVRKGVLVRDAQGNPNRVKLSPGDTVRWLRNFAQHAHPIELTPDEILDAFDKYPANVSAAKVYDLGHCLAAEKVKADVLLTRDTGDFQLLGCRARLEWP